MKFWEMFYDDNGKLSQTRVQTFFAFILAGFFMLHSYITGKPFDSEFIYVLLGYGVTQKIGNKAFEVKNGKKKE